MRNFCKSRWSTLLFKTAEDNKTYGKENYNNSMQAYWGVIIISICFVQIYSYANLKYEKAYILPHYTKPFSFILTKLFCASVFPWTAALLNHSNAFSKLCTTPWPFSYNTPRLYCAPASP